MTMSWKPAAVSSRWTSSGSAKLNGPGWSGAGAGSSARRRMIETGSEKNWLVAAVD
jgi:hypothetical protein